MTVKTIALSLLVALVPVAAQPNCGDPNPGMPSELNKALEAAGKKAKAEGHEAGETFLRLTGDAGKQWEKEWSASVDRDSLAFDRTIKKYDESAFWAGVDTNAGMTEKQLHEWSVRAARRQLESLRIINRQKEEEAEADLNFALRGGSSVALTEFRKTLNQINEVCDRESKRIYQVWWDSKKKVSPAK
jgi:hypothetical protein